MLDLFFYLFFSLVFDGVQNIRTQIVTHVLFFKFISCEVPPTCHTS